MKFNKAILALFTVSTLLFSCKKSEYKEYEGNWSGTYTGDDTGSWTINIDDEGKAEGTAVSDSVPFFTFSGEGEISKSGAVDATVELFGNRIRFVGQASGNSMSGTWNHIGEDFEGTWKGKKN
ncbi:hypothetical protein Oweho_2740 [Owenweeksia hongkongensis DSM 17368]|uniref:Uncharacterized protein n=1 Tax=Owenweeksia hongkongensis (strain DSM 17368 / CIP 108786 / JCM 12287 / NRRL B-23963 / UST20020801) TaxID=926562 RepID=G8R037_OWEHD|nr:hypothetical protein [Owenweeksia hongkongensis]AEV33703.1 hypothetical protein Oweho_2740 [Owenweeksia hongkongensis DSM 17368]